MSQAKLSSEGAKLKKKTALFSEIICALWGPMKLCLDLAQINSTWAK